MGDVPPLGGTRPSSDPAWGAPPFHWCINPHTAAGATYHAIQLGMEYRLGTSRNIACAPTYASVPSSTSATPHSRRRVASTIAPNAVPNRASRGSPTHHRLDHHRRYLAIGPCPGGMTNR